MCSRGPPQRQAGYCGRGPAAGPATQKQGVYAGGNGRASRRGRHAAAGMDGERTGPPRPWATGLIQCAAWTPRGAHGNAEDCFGYRGSAERAPAGEGAAGEGRCRCRRISVRGRKAETETRPSRHARSHGMHLRATRSRRHALATSVPNGHGDGAPHGRSTRSQRASTWFPAIALPNATRISLRCYQQRQRSRTPPAAQLGAARLPAERQLRRSREPPGSRARC